MNLTQRAIEREPRLTYFGIGVFNEARKGHEVVRSEWERLRRALLSEAGQREVELCAAWLRAGHVTGARGSYGLKHEVENHYGVYIANGSLIAAGLGLGLDYRVEGPNVVLSL